MIPDGERGSGMGRWNRVLGGTETVADTRGARRGQSTKTVAKTRPREGRDGQGMTVNVGGTAVRKWMVDRAERLQTAGAKDADLRRGRVHDRPIQPDIAGGIGIGISHVLLDLNLDLDQGVAIASH